MSSNFRTYDQLSTGEKEIAVLKCFNTVISDLLSGSKEPLSEVAFAAVKVAKNQAFPRQALLTDEVVRDWAWGIGTALAEDAVYIPDDGSLVVRLG